MVIVTNTHNTSDCLCIVWHEGLNNNADVAAFLFLDCHRDRLMKNNLVFLSASFEPKIDFLTNITCFAISQLIVRSLP
jgi:hypothetical protein